MIFARIALAVSSAPPVNPTFPGISGRVGPAAFILDFYNFALALGGLLAFIMILYAGIRYAASRGNPSSQSDAKDAITQALLGLLLLMGAYIILRTINPELVTLKLPVIERLNVPPPATGQADESGNCHPTCLSGSTHPVCRKNALNDVYMCCSGTITSGECVSVESCNDGPCEPKGGTCERDNSGEAWCRTPLDLQSCSSLNPNYLCGNPNFHPCTTSMMAGGGATCVK
ncbi:MAG: pilin, partial [Patescibacteria group bacterium]